MPNQENEPAFVNLNPLSRNPGLSIEIILCCPPVIGHEYSSHGMLGHTSYNVNARKIITKMKALTLIMLQPLFIRASNPAPSWH